MLMLSDMIRNDSNGQLIKVRMMKYKKTCTYCNNEIDEIHPVMQRVAQCTGYLKQKEELMDLIENRDKGSLKEVLNSRMYCQKLLRLLAICALMPGEGDRSDRGEDGGESDGDEEEQQEEEEEEEDDNGGIQEQTSQVHSVSEEQDLAVIDVITIDDSD
jgi:hypothetical protein